MKEIGAGFHSDRRAAFLAALVAATALTAVLSWYISYWQQTDAAAYSDVVADWVAVRGTLDGERSGSDIRMLAGQYGVVYGPASNAVARQHDERKWIDPEDLARWVHPRTSGALLELLPLLMVDADQSYLAATVLNAGLVVLLAVLIVPAVSGLDRRLVLLLAPLFLASLPVFSGFEFATQSIFLAAVLGGVWVLGRGSDSVGAGILLAIAITLKLWPAFVLLPFALLRRWRVVTWAILGTLALNLAGIAAFKTSILSDLDVLRNAGQEFLYLAGNASLVAWLGVLGVPPITGFAVVTVVGAASISWAVRRRHPDAAIALGIVFAVLASPLSWEHYGVVLLAVGAWLIGRRAAPSRAFAVSWFLMILVGLWTRWVFDAAVVGALWSLAGRVVLLTGILLWIARERESVDVA